MPSLIRMVLSVNSCSRIAIVRRSLPGNSRRSASRWVTQRTAARICRYFLRLSAKADQEGWWKKSRTTPWYQTSNWICPKENLLIGNMMSRRLYLYRLRDGLWKKVSTKTLVKEVRVIMVMVGEKV